MNLFIVMPLCWHANYIITAPFNCKRLIIKPNDGLVWVLISINGLDLDAEILLLMSLENNFKRKKNTRRIIHETKI
jgi:hypothetical protein